ncbi:MAG: methanogenesis marker protein Mmp4/MtxX [Methanomicrobiales archaeon]|nr:methanogenesis marker protein Mmp4/MtxX [Methanomicrobiales archaeon]
MTVGIGAGTDIDKVITSIRAVADRVDVSCYCREAPDNADDIVFVTADRPEELLVHDLMHDRIAAAVRGTLPAHRTLTALKDACGVQSLERIALLETPLGTRFFLAPVGVDEGWTIAQKLALMHKGRLIARKFGISDRVAVLSGGRLGDVGRHVRIDQSLAEAELLARIGGAEHREILIEDAVKTCGVIIAPDGITGNLIFRTLTMVGEGKGHGAPVVNIGKIFVDTSRASGDYTNALLLAASLAKI